MFLCPDCKRTLRLPVCDCGYTVPRKNGIYCLGPTEEEQTYPVAYSHIGRGEEDTDWLENTPLALLKGKILAEYAKNGVLLDFGCGNGALTVPALLAGCRVVAAEFRMAPLMALMKKATHHKLPMNRLTACCMREEPKLFDSGSFQCIVMDRDMAVLKDPKHSVRELYRSLKAGGTFVVFQTDAVFEQGEKYLEVLNYLYGTYWDILQGMGYAPWVSDWNMPETEFLATTFGNEKKISTNLGLRRQYTLEDCGLHRLKGKFFPDQAEIPDSTHIEACQQAIAETARRYGPNFGQIAVTEQLCALHTFLYTKEDI